MCLYPMQRGPFFFSGPGPLSNWRVFVPSIGTPVFGVWKRGRIFPCGGVLSHNEVCFLVYRVRFFFFPSWKHVGPPQRISVGICTQNHIPLSSPIYKDPGSGGFICTDPWPPDNPEWYLGSIEKITATSRIYSSEACLSLPGTSQVKHILLGNVSPSTDDGQNLCQGNR